MRQKGCIRHLMLNFISIFRAQTWNKNDTILEAVRNYAVGCGVVSLISIILTFTFVTCLNIAAQNQVKHSIY